MSTLIIFILCILSALVGYFLKIRGVRTAYIWMILVFISFMLWTALIIIPYNRFSPIIHNNWFRFGETRINLQFVINPQNWILVVSLFALNLSFLLTGISRLDIKNDLANWVFQLLLIAFSFLALISADLWSILLLWTAIDLLELGFHIMVLKDASEKIYFRRFIIKSIGSMVLIWNIASLSRSGFNPLINGIVSSIPNTSIFLAVLLHSGIFPFESESKNSSSVRSSDLLKKLFIIMNFIVSFSVITNLQTPELPFVFSLSISIIAYFLIIYFSLRWALLSGKDFSFQPLLFLESGVFIFLYFYGAAQYIIYILALLTISIFWLELFSHRSKRLLIFPFIGTFLISGLPFSLTAFGTRGFIGYGVSLGLIVFLISQIFFMIGYIKRAFASNEKFSELDIWYQVAYLVGLFIPFISAVAIIILSKAAIDLELMNWWVGAIVALIAVVGYLLLKKSISISSSEKFFGQGNRIFILRLLSLEWLFNIFSFIEIKVRGFVDGLSELMEGEGGILWALVLLILIFSMLT